MSSSDIFQSHITTFSPRRIHTQLLLVQFSFVFLQLTDYQNGLLWLSEPRSCSETNQKRLSCISFPPIRTILTIHLYMFSCWNDICFHNFDLFIFHDNLIVMKLTTISLLFTILFSTSVFGQSDVVKKSKTGICHVPGSTYYQRTQNFTPYKTLDECLRSGGRLPRK